MPGHYGKGRSAKKAAVKRGAEGPKPKPNSLMKKSPTKSVKSIMKKRGK